MLPLAMIEVRDECERGRGRNHCVFSNKLFVAVAERGEKSPLVAVYEREFFLTLTIKSYHFPLLSRVRYI